jgi:hypothetical protein
MTNGRLMNEETGNTRARQKNWQKTLARAGVGLGGLIMLSGGIGYLIDIMFSSASGLIKPNMDNLVFADNWFAWLAVIAFTMGWLTVRWSESTLLKSHIKTATVLFGIFVLEGAVTSLCLRYLVKYEMLREFGDAALFLITSGGLLRFAMLSDEALAKLSEWRNGRGS